MGPDCDALFIGCSQLPTHAILGGLQAEFARPAWSSIKATAWDAAHGCLLPPDTRADNGRRNRTMNRRTLLALPRSFP